MIADQSSLHTYPGAVAPQWLIYGCRTTYTAEVAEILWRAGANIAAYVDNLPGPPEPQPGRVIVPADLTGADLRLPVIIPLITPGHRPVVEAEARRVGLSLFPPLLDPTSVMARTAEIGEGTIINALAVIGARSRLGRFVHVNRSASVGHDANIGDYATMGPACVVTGQVTIGRGAFVGAGAILVPKVRIGENSTICAGAVVTRDVPPGSTMAGNPARLVRTSSPGYGGVSVPIGQGHSTAS